MIYSMRNDLGRRFMMNRIVDTISQVEKQLAFVGGEKQAALHRKLDMSLEEYVQFQQTKSQAQALGIISLEEAQMIYSYLGESVGVFNKQTLAVKVVLTKLFQELLFNESVGSI